MDFKDDRPIYLQIAALVCEDILSEKWKIPGKIPSVRDLASELTVNPHTVLRAYEYLELNKIVENKRGVGFFISDNSVKEILKSRRKLFYKEYLPQFFKMLESLEISISEINLLYKEFQNKE